jgi:subtilisin family serine protease
VTVAVLDTGVQADHPSLQGHLLPGFNAISPGNTPDDVVDGKSNQAFGHGTMVAGIVARVAPETKILPVRVLNADGSGSLFDVVRGLRWAVANGAQVVNLSFGTLESSGILRQAINDARHAGVIVVASAGNAGQDVRDYPAGFSETISVAAVDPNDAKASYSNFGSHVRLSAPGTGIISTFPNSRFAAWSGTSFAAPFVAGVAALVRAAHPGADPDKIGDALEKTARPLDGIANSGYQGRLGKGIVDAGRAVTADVD